MRQILYTLLFIVSILNHNFGQATALHFDGTNDYINTPLTTNYVLDDLTEFTIETWVKLDALPAVQSVLFYIPKITNCDIQVQGIIHSTGAITFGIDKFACAGGGWNFTGAPAGTISAAQWHHIAFVRYNNGGSKHMYIYIDGILVASGLQTRDTNIPANAALFIGSDNNGNFSIPGIIDEFRFWTKAKTCAEISAQMNCELTGNETSLVAYFDFNQGNHNAPNPTETTLIDRQTNLPQNNGTLNNFALTSTTSNWLIPATSNGVSGNCSGTTAAEINLLGNGNTIADGDASPDITDGTEMGQAGICGGTVTQTFTLENTGGSTLSINSISPTNSIFTISGITLPATIAAASFINFDVTFSPTALGTQSSTINIDNNDCDETLYNFVVRGEGIAGGPGIGDPIRGDALIFDGTNDFIDMGNPATLNITTNISLEAWVNVNNISGDQKIITKFGDVALDDAYSLQLINGEPVFNLDLGAGWQTCSAGSIISTGIWYHIAATYNGSNMRIYINGIEQNATANTGLIDVSASTFKLGAWAGGNNLNGQLDEVRIWNTTRTANEIRENMHLTLSGCDNGLVAYYQMNDGTGSGTLTDKTGNGNIGTLTNMDPATDWVTSGVNVGNDASSNSNSQTINVAAGQSTATFTNANATMRFFAHSGVEDVTVTYQAFTPNGIVGADGVNIIQNPVWTVNKASATETILADYTFMFPAATFTSTDPAKYSLYYRAMNSEGNWAKIATANAVTTASATFGKISLTGQFMVVQESENDISDVRGNMYTFDGTQFIDNSATATGLPQGNAARTIEAWVKTTQTTIGNIVSWGRQTNNNRNGFAVRNNAIAYIGAFNDFTGTIVINDGVWHHVALTHDGTTMSLYVDGRLDASSNRSINTLDQNLRLGTISLPSNGENYIGSMDEVRIWNVALTREQLRENMHLTLKGNEAGLVSYFQFNNDDPVGTAAGVKDAVGGSNGTTVNMLIAAYIPSEVAIAGGASDRVTIGGSGTYSFPNTGVEITFGASTPSGEIVISRLETEKPHGWESIGNDVDNEYFVVKNYGTNTFAPLTDITFNRLSYVSPADVGVPQASSPLQLYKRADNAYGATWGTSFGGADNASAGTNAMISYDANNNITSFSQIVLVNTALNSGLPVELLDFDATRLNADEVQLNWSTATEMNNKGFYIERMLEIEGTFESIAFVKGQGTTIATTQYNLTDNNSYSGVSYYRLRQEDIDGTTTYSDIRAVEGNKVSNQLFDLSIYPNPVYKELSIRFNELPKEVNKATICIQSINGQLLYKSTTAITSYSVNTIEQIAALPAALYILSIELNNGKRVAHKFIKE